jgi:hypothetical protein
MAEGSQRVELLGHHADGRDDEVNCSVDNGARNSGAHAVFSSGTNRETVSSDQRYHGTAGARFSLAAAAMMHLMTKVGD